MIPTVDLVVIGAGPAGMAAATEAAKAGLSVTVLDESPVPGGQIYRGIETASPRWLQILGPEYAEGRSIVESFRASGTRYLPGALVWNIGTDRVVDYSHEGISHQVQAGAIIAATGALERPMPIPGWTLPGVTTVGALQILLKGSGLVAEDAVLVGAGPLLWLLAAQMVDAGCPPRAVVENLPRGRMRAALPHLPGALRARSYFLKGLELMRKVKRAGVPIHRHASGLSIEGFDAVRALTFSAAGRSQRIDTTSIALHQGVVPNQQVTRLMRADHRWDASQHCFRPVLDTMGQASVPGLYVAGEGAGIAGAKAGRPPGPAGGTGDRRRRAPAWIGCAPR